MKVTNPHTMLVKQCLELLSWLQIPAWKNNTMAAKIGGRFIRAGTPGSADIMCVLPPRGTLLCVEAKTGRGKQSDEQKAFQRNVERAGGVYLVVRDVRDLREYFQ